MSLKNTFKGWFAEKVVGLAIWAGFDSKTYRRLGNLIVEDSRGSTQIDQLLISPYGIFVIEIKDYKGWIYGSVKQKKWTQTFKTVKYPFQNPIHQNYRHIKALCETLGLEEKQFHTVIFFCGECEIKTKLPPYVLNKNVRGYIQSFTDIIFTNEECDRMMDILTGIKKRQIGSKKSFKINETTVTKGPTVAAMSAAIIISTFFKAKN